MCVACAVRKAPRTGLEPFVLPFPMDKLIIIQPSTKNNKVAVKSDVKTGRI